MFFFIEALLGAGLVLLRYVAQDASAGRALYLSAHLVNTQILLATLALAAWYGGGAAPVVWRNAPKLVLGALPVALVVSVTGVIAALGDTLYPAASLTAGLRQEFSSASGALLRLRMVHPLVAMAAGIYLLAAAAAALRSKTAAVSRMGGIVAMLVFLQFVAGFVNIALLAPIAMQILHLLIADLLWVALVVMSLEAGAAVLATEPRP